VNNALASVSLDLDNRWSYMKTHGDPGWQSFPSYLDLVVPRFLKFLTQRKMRITVFVVGQDAALECNAASLRAIADAGHEIGNHSFRHEPWLHLYGAEEVEREIALAERHIFAVTGKKPIGFRGPGFSLSPNALEALARLGYRYDASTFPTFIGPLARAYYFMKSKLGAADLQQRSALFGGVRQGFRPLKAYRWRIPAGDIVEIPVTTMPLLRLPIHTSYVLYLSTLSRRLALAYFDLALAMCRMTGVQPSLLLHSLDFLGSDDGVGLEFFPGMSLPYRRKLDIVDSVLASLRRHYRLVTMEQHARAVVGAAPAKRLSYAS